MTQERHNSDPKPARSFGPVPLRLLLLVPLGLIVVALVFAASRLFPSVSQTTWALIFAFGIAAAFAFAAPRRKR